MTTWNTINYMKFVAADQLGHDPDAKPHPTNSDQWCLRADNPDRLGDHMERFGYEVARYDGWVGVSGYPTNVDAVRDLEVRWALERVEQIRSASDGEVMRMTNRF